MAYNPQNPNGQATMANSAPVVIASDQSDLPVTISQEDSFGQIVSATRYNQVEIDFSSTAPASITELTVTSNNGGSSSNSNGQGVFSSSTNTNGGVKAVSDYTVDYRPHAETYAAFTAIFTTGVSSSHQRIGIYDTDNGFFIGYEGTSFGVTVRKATVDTTIPQASWNVDTLTGTANSKYTNNGTPMTFDPSKDNLFRIRFGWLGAATVLFEIYSPDGHWVLFHAYRVANINTSPTVNNPNLPVTLDIQKSTAGATDLIMKTACWGAGSTSAYNKITASINDYTLAQLTRSVITGVTTGGGGGYVNVKVNPSGALVTATTLDAGTATIGSINNISGTISLPTGAATESTLSTLNTKIPSNLTVTSTRLLVDGSGVTQPISGTITANIGTIGTIATESTLSTLNGKVPSGLTVTSTRLLVDGSGVTQPISAASLPLPSGAATAAKQPALGTAGTASADVISVQGIAGMTALKVDGSAVTQPVSGTVTANAGTGNFTVVQSTATSLKTQAECYQGGSAVSSTNPLNVTVAASTSGGVSSATGSLTNTATAVSASAGQVYGWFIYNPNSTVAYIQFYNVAAGSVVVGTTTPVYSIGIPGLASANVFGPGIVHSTAISVAATTTRAGSTAPGANLDYNIFYK